MTMCYSPKPQSFYTTELDVNPMNLSIGLGDSTRVTSPELWNYCSVTSRLPFLWESGVVKPKDLPSLFTDLEALKTDLNRTVGGYRVRTLIAKLTPEKFLDVVESNPVTHLHKCKFFGSESDFRLVVKGRVFAWKVSQGMELTDREQAILDMVGSNV